MPSTVCVSCRQDVPTKLLRCLHGLCVGCLLKYLTRSNEVRCPDCTELTPSAGEGKSQLAFLPDNCAAGRSGISTEKQSGRQLFCEECLESEDAIAKCVDCNTLLCGDHGQLHPRNRSTYKHRVVAFDALAEEDLGTKEHYCIIHSDSKLRTFCIECNDLLCERCLKSGHDADHCVMSVEDAVVMMRSSVEASLATGSAAAAAAAADGGDGESDGVVSEAIESVSTAIKELHGHTESVSEQVQDYFKGVVEWVTTREANVLDGVDRLRSTLLLPLEQQKLHLLESQATRETISALLANCDDPCSLLRMGSWLEEAAKKANALAEKHRIPSEARLPAFIPGNTSELAATIADAGDAVAAIAGRRAVTPTAMLSQDSSISSSGGGPGLQEAFHPYRRHGDIELSNGNRTARRRVAGYSGMFCYRSVCGANVYSRGRHDIQVRIDCADKDTDVIIFLCNSPEPALGLPHDYRVAGTLLCGPAAEGICKFTKYCGGVCLGARWQSGDVLRLSLDCDRHTVTGCHDPTGTTLTLSDLHGDLYLYVCIEVEGSQVTIL